MFVFLQTWCGNLLRVSSCFADFLKKNLFLRMKDHFAVVHYKIKSKYHESNFCPVLIDFFKSTISLITSK